MMLETIATQIAIGFTFSWVLALAGFGFLWVFVLAMFGLCDWMHRRGWL